MMLELRVREGYDDGRVGWAPYMQAVACLHDQRPLIVDWVIWFEDTWGQR